MDNPYALAQWNQAVLTAATTPDAAVRTRAQQRLGQWGRVLAGMRSGTLHIGSRTPVAGVPAWVTPEVVRGGFATGLAAAAGPLSAFELDLAREAATSETRGAVFAYAISEPGMRRLWAALDDGRFQIDVPEAAALLVVAWLVRERDIDTALALLATLRPYADALRFLPASESASPRDPGAMWRDEASDVADALRAARPRPRIVRMNEILDVWNPWADAFLRHWLPVADADRLEGPYEETWLESGRQLLAEYDRVASVLAPPRKHVDPKENAAALRRALVEVTHGRALSPRERGRIRLAIESMVARRGRPGAPEHDALRRRQHVQAVLPATATYAHLAAERLAPVPAGLGVDDVESVLGAVTPAEAAATTLPVGAPLPTAVRRTVLRAQTGTLHQLVDRGVITSPELLAVLVPQVTAQVVADRHDDPALRRLVAASYEAFRRRRSLLLLDLEEQVRADELPWIAVTTRRGRDTLATREVARATLLRVADEAITFWPGVILPNAFVSELATLASSASLPAPWVREVAADLFMNRFSRAYADAHAVAVPLVSGTVYAQYYRLTPPRPGRRRRAARPAAPFADLCASRAATPRHRGCVVCNGMVLEQAQILTTHNLATLGALGFAPQHGWDTAARGAFTHAAGLMTRLDGNRRPNRMLKDIAYAWRQMVFFLSRLDGAAQSAFLGWAADDTARRSDFARTRLRTLLDELARPGEHPPLLGWTHGRHRLLPDG